jgi:twitching motility two-component system response regulator PilH
MLEEVVMQTPANATNDGKTPVILVVDDSLADRTTLSQIVEGAGYRVITAASGSEALEKARSDHPGLIFLDIMMDDMDGYQACRTLHRGPDTSRIPVVMVSAKKNRADKVWAAEQGAADYIVKPFAPEQILSVLQRYLH